MATIFDTAAKSMLSGANTTGAVAAGGLPAQSMNAYINPHQSSVLHDTLGRMRDVYLQQNQRIGDQAIAGGAFGGDRHAITEAMAFDDYLRGASETANRINQTGFDTALGAGFQDVGLRAQAGRDLFGMGTSSYNIGRNISQDLLSQGAAQQGLNQSILGQGAGYYDDYVNSPTVSTGRTAQILSGSPLGMNTTRSTKPGLFDYLGLGLQTAGGMGGGK